MRPGGGRGRGITALFAGDSGTGKTMSAEVIAGELGLDLYTINLATVVDKYVGETEKHLERIFSEADGVNGVLPSDRSAVTERGTRLQLSLFEAEEHPGLGELRKLDLTTMTPIEALTALYQLQKKAV